MRFAPLATYTNVNGEYRFPSKFDGPISAIQSLILALAGAVACICGYHLAAFAAPGTSGSPREMPAGLTIPPSPPANFDPLTAPDTELLAYGFPPRPDSRIHPQAYAHWSKMVSAGNNRIVPTFERTNTYHGPAQNLASGGKTPAPAETPAAAGLGAAAIVPPNTTVMNSFNWSGFADYEPAGPFLGNNSFVTGQWIVPFAQKSSITCQHATDVQSSAQWGGFDGFYPGYINSALALQAGSEADVSCDGATKSYYLWFGWGPATKIANFPISPGDVIDVTVWYTARATHGAAYLVDSTTHQATGVRFNPSQGIVYYGTSAEWVVEAPIIECPPLFSRRVPNIPIVLQCYPLLMNYTATAWNFAAAYSPATGLYYEPGYAPSGTAYDILMQKSYTDATPISYCNLYPAYALWCYPSGI